MLRDASTVLSTKTSTQTACFKGRDFFKRRTGIAETNKIKSLVLVEWAEKAYHECEKIIEVNIRSPCVYLFPRFSFFLIMSRFFSSCATDSAL
jgi:hypothetical protein